MDKLDGCQIIPLVDPKTGEELKLNKDGVFENKKTKSYFAVTDSGFVVELIDPETKGKAHIEKNILVSDVTGKKYEIDDKGNIIIEKAENNSKKKKSKTKVNTTTKKVKDKNNVTDDKPLTKEEQEERFKFYIITVSIILLIAFSIIGIILLFG